MPYLFDALSDEEFTTFVIVPKDHPLYGADGHAREVPTLIEHQYGCWECQQFKIEGRAERIADAMQARAIARELGCDGGHRPDVLAGIIGVPVKKVLGESLAELEDGRYLATLNCD